MNRVFIILIILIFASCGRNERHNSGSMFCPVGTGKPMIDSVCAELERAVYNSEPITVKQFLIDSLENIDKRESDHALLKARVAIWKSRLLKNIDEERAINIANAALEGLDTLRYPYEYHNLLMESSSESSEIVKNYLTLLKVLKYGREIGDSLLVGRTLTRLGILTRSFRPNPTSDDYFHKAGKAYIDAGYKKYWMKNLFNIATQETDLIKSIKVLKYLDRQSDIMQDTTFREIVKRSLFLNTHSPEYLRDNIKMLKYDKLRSDAYGINLMLLAHHFMQNMQNDMALNLSSEAERYLRPGRTDTRLLCWLYRQNSYLYHAAGVLDSAYKYASLYAWWTDSLHSELSDKELMATDAKIKILQMENATRLEIQKRNTRWWLISLIILSVTILAIFLIYRKGKERQLNAYKIREELYKNRMILASRSLVLEEKCKVIDDVGNVVKSLRNEGRLKSAEASEINTVLNIHKSSDMERVGFMDIHQNLDPNFYKRLKTDFPSLTESQLRLAAYISLGMTNQQIARLLNIEYDSIKKSRYRLRTKLGLSTQDSLEDFIRSYTNPE